MTIKAINVRNQFKGSIKEIVLGDVLSEIDVQTASGIVTSVITTRSVKELELAVGSALLTAPPSARLFASAAILPAQHAQAFDTCSAALPATTSSATITPSKPAEVAEDAARAPLTWQL